MPLPPHQPRPLCLARVTTWLPPMCTLARCLLEAAQVRTRDGSSQAMDLITTTARSDVRTTCFAFHRAFSWRSRGYASYFCTSTLQTAESLLTSRCRTYRHTGGGGLERTGQLKCAFAEVRGVAGCAEGGLLRLVSPLTIASRCAFCCWSLSLSTSPHLAHQTEPPCAIPRRHPRPNCTTQTCAHARAHTHTHAHTRAHAHTHARTHSHARTYAHTRSF